MLKTYVKGEPTYKCERLSFLVVNGVGYDASMGQGEGGYQPLGEGGGQGLGGRAGQGGGQQAGQQEHQQAGGGHGRGVGHRQDCHQCYCRLSW